MLQSCFLFDILTSLQYVLGILSATKDCESFRVVDHMSNYLSTTFGIFNTFSITSKRKWLPREANDVQLHSCCVLVVSPDDVVIEYVMF